MPLRPWLVFKINKYKQNGFTLVELMVTITIAGLLFGIAIPSFQSSIQSNRLTTMGNELVLALNMARSEAIKRGEQVVVRRFGAEWEDGWQIFVDIDRTTAAKTDVFDSGQDLSLKVLPPLTRAYTLRSDNFPTFIRYTPSGLSNASGFFIICDNSDGNEVAEANTSRLILINPVGRIKMGIDTDNPKDGIPNIDDVTNSTDCTP